jgi:hypothetical protein
MPELSISPEKVCFIVMRARGFDAKEAGPGLGEGSNPSDQGIEDEIGDLDVLDDSMPDASEEELRDAIIALNEDEQIELIMLMRLGRDDTAVPDDWDEIHEEVAASQTTPPEDYLLGTPLLAEYLEAGLEKLGISCVDLEPSGAGPDATAPARSTR